MWSDSKSRQRKESDGAAVDSVKQRVNNIGLWQTLEKSVAIAIEDNILIVGINGQYFNEAGRMTTADAKNCIEVAASQIAGTSLRLRVIDGDTEADWITTKKREERVAAMQTATYDRRDRDEASAQSWDALMDYIARSYSATTNRSLPQVKSRDLSDMLYALSDAMDVLYPDDHDEQTERMLARAIEKVAGNAEVPGTMVALELERLRAWQRQNQS